LGSGLGLTIGCILYPLSFLEMGFVYTLPTSLDMQTESTHIFSEEPVIQDGTLDIPGSWGGGISLHLKEQTVIGMEVLHNDWDRMRFNGETFDGLQNTTRISIGGETTPSRDPYRPYHARMTYRLGVTYEPYFAKDPTNRNVNTLWVTSGIGLPFFQNSSRIDIAIAYGKRGSLQTNGLSEHLFRVGLAVTASEKWFRRRQ
jgi:hypothetical protein